jgi:hypothetical protein
MDDGMRITPITINLTCPDEVARRWSSKSKGIAGRLGHRSLRLKSTGSHSRCL